MSISNLQPNETSVTVKFLETKPALNKRDAVIKAKMASAQAIILFPSFQSKTHLGKISTVQYIAHRLFGAARLYKINRAVTSRPYTSLKYVGEFSDKKIAMLQKSLEGLSYPTMICKVHGGVIIRVFLN
jgi:hypothetical protein